jgi:hypothetical protein
MLTSASFTWKDAMLTLTDGDYMAMFHKATIHEIPCCIEVYYAASDPMNSSVEISLWRTESDMFMEAAAYLDQDFGVYREFSYDGVADRFEAWVLENVDYWDVHVRSSPPENWEAGMLPYVYNERCWSYEKALSTLRNVTIMNIACKYHFEWARIILPNGDIEVYNEAGEKSFTAIADPADTEEKEEYCGRTE